MGASEISVQPDQIFAELFEVLSHLNNLPEASEVGLTQGASASDSPAAYEFRRSLNDLGIQLSRTVRATAQHMFDLSDDIRAAVKYQVELDASFADEAKAITGMLDSLDDYFPGMVKTTPGDTGLPAGSGGGPRLTAQ
ncbi:hypothetical protein ACWKWP_01710 [Agromyces soli]